MDESDSNPFSPPPDHRQRRRKLSGDPSVEHEPHLTHDRFESDPSEQTTDFVLANSTPTINDEVDHSVWDEPGLSRSLTGPTPANATTYAKWLELQIAETSTSRSHWVTILVAAASGFCAIFGAFFGHPRTWNSLLAVCLIGPLTEEIMKVAVAIWVVEKRPFLFMSVPQILCCTSLSGLVFAVVENLLYLNVYIDDPSDRLTHWRWTVCVALHVSCSFIAGLGVARIWKQSIAQKSRPQLPLGAAWMTTAIVIHSVYNCLAVLLASGESGF